MIGLKRGTVVLLKHDPEWDICAAETIEILKGIFGTVACDICHVGSTSIPTIKAKPIIDIAVAVRKLSDVEPLIVQMREHGFHRKDVGHDQQVFFSAGDFEQDIRTHHIHVVEYEGMEWRNYLNFKTYLISHPTVARQYEALKESLVAQFSNDRSTYTDGKATFIRHTLRKAMVWSYLGQTVRIGIDRPIGHAHKKDIVYPINYGYIPGVLGGDGEELDVYLMGVDEPVDSYTAKIIAIVHRENDVEDKLVAAPEGMTFTQAEIAEAVHFQEKYYDSHIEALYDGFTVREYRKYCEDEILPLYEAVGWSSYTSRPTMLADAFANSLLTLAAYKDDLPIGLIRVVGDGHSSVLIQDLLVLPSQQQHGIGSALVREIQMRYRDIYRIQLLTDPDERLSRFYHSCGFESVKSQGMKAMVAVQRPTKDTPYHIRQMDESEIESCVALIRCSFQTVADEFGFTVQNAPRFTAFAIDAERLMTQHKEGRPMFVCIDKEEKTLGYYSLCQKDTETVEMNNLCVAPECRHRKIGRELLLHAIRQAMIIGYRYMTIGIVEENQRLRAWYEKYGFVHTGTQKFDFFPFTCGYMRKQLFGNDA